jgi:Fe-S cluster assembly iron-binding protein IscA
MEAFYSFNNIQVYQLDKIMNRFFIDDKAIEFLRKALEKEKSPEMRVFISGGGCCKQLEITPVKKALAGDVTCDEKGIKVNIEKQIADNTDSIEILFDEKKGLLIYFEKKSGKL